MDHTFKRHRHWQGYGTISRLPSEFFDENIYVTFQDDFSVRYALEGMNTDRILWATDFPHSDGTYPHSEEVAKELTSHMTEAQAKAIFHDSVAELYELSV